MIDLYKTIYEPVEGIFKDRASKFLAFAFPVNSEDEVNQILKNLRKKYYDANHHVYAFRLGAEKNIFRASDDGEPANSSGPPVLGQIKSLDLTNILIVVVRYFGGTKLGVPGLINAYKSAANAALSNAKIIEKTINNYLKLNFDYLAMNDVMKLIKDEQIEQSEQHFDLECSMVISVRLSDFQRIADKLNKISNLKFQIVKTE